MVQVLRSILVVMRGLSGTGPVQALPLVSTAVSVMAKQPDSGTTGMGQKASESVAPSVTKHPADFIALYTSPAPA